MPFRDRSDAGRQLAAKPGHLRDRHPVVLAQWCGGVPVRYEIPTTMRVALQAIRRRNPSHLALTAPVVASETLASLRTEADEAVCVETPPGLGAIGFFCRDFHQVSDAQMTEIPGRAAQHGDAA